MCNTCNVELISASKALLSYYLCACRSTKVLDCWCNCHMGQSGGYLALFQSWTAFWSNTLRESRCLSKYDHATNTLAATAHAPTLGRKQNIRKYLGIISCISLTYNWSHLIQIHSPYLNCLEEPFPQMFLSVRINLSIIHYISSNDLNINMNNELI